MNIFNRICYHTWNIGFIENDIPSVILGGETKVRVKWVKHKYKDRFFADPFILSIDDRVIKVLVEDYPYYNKVGQISLLTVDRKTYELIDRKEILKQPFHMSYPFIQRLDSGDFWVAPEASMSGKLYRYTMNSVSETLENQTLLLDEPALDSTIIEYKGKYWLFCTKRGMASNRDLYIYYSDMPEGPWTPHKCNPVLSDAKTARPAGYMINIDGAIYRVTQKCDKHYGEAINITKVSVLNETEFKEIFVKELRAQKDNYSECFHTINSISGGNICVVDGVRKDFRPIRRIWYELRNKLHIKHEER